MCLCVSIEASTHPRHLLAPQHRPCIPLASPPRRCFHLMSLLPLPFAFSLFCLQRDMPVSWVWSELLRALELRGSSLGPKGVEVVGLRRDGVDRKYLELDREACLRGSGERRRLGCAPSTVTRRSRYHFTS